LKQYCCDEKPSASRHTLIAALAVITVNPVQAGVLSPSEIVSQFNAVIFGTFKSSADVEGRAVVGGNLKGGQL
jgi:Putative Ice-binding-like adhesive domain